MDSNFVNYDGRSVHDMIELLLYASGDPEAIRRLQESINDVDRRAQSSISVVNAAIDQLDDYNDTQDVEIAALTTTGGVKNIVPNEGPDTLVQAGITFTKNADGSVTANGTATGTAIYRMNENFSLPIGKYVITGSPSGAADDKFFIQLHKQNVVTHRDTGNPIYPQEWNETGETVYDWYGVALLNGVVADNLTFYPMIRPQGTNHDYVEGMYPNNVFTDTGWVLIDETTQTKYRKKDGVVYVRIYITAAAVPSMTGGTWNNIHTLPAGSKPTETIEGIVALRKSSNNICDIYPAQINTSGAIQILLPNGVTVDSTSHNAIYGNLVFPV